jgi:hypothetical protein
MLPLNFQTKEPLSDLAHTTMENGRTILKSRVLARKDDLTLKGMLYTDISVQNRQSHESKIIFLRGVHKVQKIFMTEN